MTYRPIHYSHSIASALHNIGFHLSVCSIGPVSHYIHEHKALEFYRVIYVGIKIQPLNYVNPKVA